MQLVVGLQLTLNIPLRPRRAQDADRYLRPGMGAEARRTARQRALLEDGIHPATRLRVTAAGSCADCLHLRLKQHPENSTKRWFKCALTLTGTGTGPDIRKRWPSCAAWHPTSTEESDHSRP